MAGRGPSPKSLEQRRNFSEPLRGEWVPVPAGAKTKLPRLPDDEWSPRTETAWKAWSKDPVTSLYGPAEVQLAIDLAYLYEQWVDLGGSKLAGEIRQRQDGLGLSPKGKQDRRWRVVAAEAEPEKDAEVTELRPLRSVS
jgi:hypothetical protein